MLNNNETMPVMNKIWKLAEELQKKKNQMEMVELKNAISEILEIHMMGYIKMTVEELS